MDFFRPYSNPMNIGNYQPHPQPQQQPQLRTNKIFVTSLEDALNRYAEPNTILVYRHQDEKFEYEIMTDCQGKKTYKTLQLTDYTAQQAEKQTATATISTEQLQAFESRLTALENEMSKHNKIDGGNE